MPASLIASDNSKHRSASANLEARAGVSGACKRGQALEDSDNGEYGASGGRGAARKPVRKRRAAAPVSPEQVDDLKDAGSEGEADDLDAFEDGYGSDLMGDDEDRSVGATAG